MEDKINNFKEKCKSNICLQSEDQDFKSITKSWFNKSTDYSYSYNFEFIGRPIIQYPQDIIALQEIIWKVKPDLIIETGIARGGSLIFSATMLALLDLGDVMTKKNDKKSHNSRRRVLGIDIDIRPHEANVTTS